MTYEFTFPDVGEGISEGEIVKWKVKAGDKIKEGDVLVEIETDKAVVDIPSPINGRILQTQKKEGAKIKVGEILVTIDDGKKEKTSSRISDSSKKHGPGVIGEIEEASETKQDGAKIMLRKSEQAGIEQKQEEKKTLRVVKKYDMYGYTDRKPLKAVRRATAQHMTLAVRSAALTTVMSDIDATTLWNEREERKKELIKKKIKLTFLPYLVKACAMALRDHPHLNAELDEENGEILLKKYYNIGIAVDTEDGLLVPVIKIANEKSIEAIAKEIETLAETARKRKINLAELRGGTFTITNYGSYGAKYGNPITNHPETSILGVGRIFEKVVKNGNNFEVRKILPLSITFDHRVTDGGDASRFLSLLGGILQKPEKIA